MVLNLVKGLNGDCSSKHMNRTRNLLLLIVLPLLVVVGVVLNRKSEKSASSSSAIPSADQGEVAAVSQDVDVPESFLTLDFGDGRVATYSATWANPKSALERLLEAAKLQGFAVDYETTAMGAWIKAIGGVPNTDRKFWLFWVNGQPAEVASDKQILAPGDRVEFRFTAM